MQHEEILQLYGLQDKEAKVYLANLALGQAPVSTIARHVSIHRVTVYSILKNLVQQGIIQLYEKGNTAYYTAVDPYLLAQNLQEKYEQFTAHLPELAAIAHKLDTKPKVKYYDGLEGLKVLMKEIINTGYKPDAQPFLSFLGSADSDPRFEEFLRHEFIPFRLKCPNPTKTLISAQSSVYQHYSQKYLEATVIPDDLFSMGNEIVVYDHTKVAILLYNTTEVGGLLIDSLTLHQALHNIFFMLRKIYSR